MSLLDELNNAGGSDESEEDDDYVPSGSSSPKAKRLKSNPETDEDTEENGHSQYANLQSLSDFHLQKVLSSNNNAKIITALGHFNSDEARQPAIVLLEKTPFNDKQLGQLTSDISLTQILQNDIYGTYKGIPKADLNIIKMTLIYPATEKHIDKYSQKETYSICETPALYQSTTEPYINLTANTFSLKWVYNILDHISETERIIFEDPDPETGFILLPDMKWNGLQLENLYVVALCFKKGLKTLRDFTQDHLGLLKNIREKGFSAIMEKYNIPKHKLRVYIHYLPSYYHFHVHFTALTFDAPGSSCDRAHPLDVVIGNIEMNSNYYQNCTLDYQVKHGDVLFEKLNETLHLEANNLVHT